MFNLILRGLATGSIYSLTAVGIVLILSTTNVMNFAQGDTGMFLTYIAFFFILRGIAPSLTLPIVIAVGAVLGYLVYKGLISKAKKSSHLGMMIITLGLTMIFRSYQVTPCISDR